MLAGVVKGIKLTLLLPLIPSMAVAAVVISFTLMGFGVVVAGIVNSRFIFLPMINQIEGNNDDGCNLCVGEERGKWISAAAVDSGVCDDRAPSNAAATNANWLCMDFEFHVSVELGYEIFPQ